MAKKDENTQALEVPTEAPAGAPTKAVTYEVVGLKPREDKTMPIMVGGQTIDLAVADQQTLRALYEAGKRFVKISDK
jgi:hypothetical protein